MRKSNLTDFSFLDTSVASVSLPNVFQLFRLPLFSLWAASHFGAPGGSRRPACAGARSPALPTPPSAAAASKPALRDLLAGKAASC